MESTNKKPRCHHISKIGARCMADPQTGKNYCFFHDPEQKKKQAEARKQGGEARSRQTEPEITLPPNLSVLPLKTGGDVHKLMIETINHLRCRKMDLRSARTIGYLSGIELRALKLHYTPGALLMEEIINQFRRREIDLPTAKTFGMLASVLLSAVRQEDEEREAAAIATAEAATANPLTRSAQAFAAENVRPGGIESVVTAIVAAKAHSDQDHDLHPAIIHGNAGNTPDHGGLQTA
jgi:hypothetical protein